MRHKSLKFHDNGVCCNPAETLAIRWAISELKVTQRKHDPEVILNREQFGHLEYAIVKIEKAELPSLSSSGNCYRYVVANTVSEVTGYRQGTKEEVIDYCDILIEDLNQRTIPKKKI